MCGALPHSSTRWSRRSLLLLCPKHTWPAAVFSPTNNRWKKSNRNHGPGSPLKQKPSQRKWGLGSRCCCVIMSRCPLAPEPDWLQVHSPGRAEEELCFALPIGWAENYRLTSNTWFVLDKNLSRDFGGAVFSKAALTRSTLFVWLRHCWMVGAAGAKPGSDLTP